jgi:membrane-bound lytic murein transglycosylase B
MMGAVPLVSLVSTLLVAVALTTSSPATPQSTSGDATASPGSTAASFDAFLSDIRTEALARGIKADTLDRALAGLTPDPVVVSRDRNQPEIVQSLDAYVRQRLTPRTLATAREMAVRHRALLDRIDAKYGVPRTLMIAIWGLESNFGRFTGSYPTIQALATLAYDNRRPIFRGELLAALTMVDRGLVRPEDMSGSWAGAMGQPQFMPSSFLKHAVDFDEDGTIDIWTSPADVFGSMAHYLAQAGWTRGERWGREVKISRTALTAIDRHVPMRTRGCRAIRAMTVPRPLSEWAKLGVTLPNGHALPSVSMDASLVRGTTRYFLVYRNYEAVIDYNCSHSYAIAAGLLADAIK